MSSRHNLGFAFMAIFVVSAPAFARDPALLNQAVTDSYEERAGVEAEYKTNQAVQAKEDPAPESNSIPVVLGDELGGTSHSSSDHLKFHSEPRSYNEKRVAAKLDKEWKEVNRSVKRASHEIKDEPTKKVSQKKVENEGDDF